MQIGTNSMAPHYASLHKKEQDKELDKLSSGTKLEATDPAMMQIAQALMSDATVMSQGIQNANESVAMLQIADGTLQNISKMTTDLEALGVRYNSASLNSEQKSMLEGEFKATTKAIDDALEQSSYNGQNLFGKNFTTSMGRSELSFSLPELDTSKLSIDDSDTLKDFRNTINDAISSIGSAQNGFQSSIDSLLSGRTAQLSAYSQMADTDIAQSVSSFNQENIMSQTAMFAQSHQQQLDHERVSALLA